eukprot:756291-Pelagomonas_calceolata.AAC.2
MAELGNWMRRTARLLLNQQRHHEHATLEEHADEEVREPAEFQGIQAVRVTEPAAGVCFSMVRKESAASLSDRGKERGLQRGSGSERGGGPFILGPLSMTHSRAQPALFKWCPRMLVVQTLTELNLSIRKARISSDGGWFVDGEYARVCEEFFVSETPRGKVTDARKLNLIRQ